MKILVCGGRDFNKRGIVRRVLAMSGATKIIHGDAPGADSLAGQWARENGVDEWPFPAEWERYGRSAGPLRNEKMLRESKPDKVIAFPGGRGTAHMVRLARAAGVPVSEIADD